MPHRFREISLPIGTPICLFNYDETIGGSEILYGTIANYLVLETPPQYQSFFGKEIDTGVVMTVRENSDHLCAFQSLILLLCYRDSAWSTSDTNVFTYGVLREEILSRPESILTAEVWEAATIHLGYRAIFMVADPASEILITLRERFSKSGG
jgi:hypothetical protein